ncbi:hypothetical protein B9Z55_015061 [Caenorhabditis nigoni]|uniref:SUN domain-containing protein n=1 Tax=Caenorhabditis nigoni TaxID=1611254 RepID=A0A2G5U8P5_9PELO|nr:hypothetical protein B9Z55_015061 [Caenorhabditis nigoni]
MLPTRTNKLDTEEPTRIWHHWFNIRVRQYMILEIFFIISLIMILYRFQTISNQNDRVLEMVNSMHSRFGNIERKLESLISRIQNADINPFHNTEPLEQSIADELKSMEFPTQKSTDNMELIIIPQINQPTSKTAESTLKIPIQNEKFRFNAADFLRGATVDIARSSSFNLNPIIGFDQANIVLLDRPQPPADEARCTTDKNPVLTINLAKYIKPISVSYQHSKWNGTIPNGDPKTYDVVACLDFYCGKRKPLVSNCQYSPGELNATEQMCNISPHLDVPSIHKVQFRFRENYGDTKMTCVHLVRVYGETKTPPKSGEMCTNLTRSVKTVPLSTTTTAAPSVPNVVRNV